MVQSERDLLITAMTRFWEKVKKKIGAQKLEEIRRKEAQMGEHRLHLLHKFGHLTYADQVALMIEVGKEMGINCKDGKDLKATSLSAPVEITNYKIELGDGTIISTAPLPPTKKGGEVYIVSKSKIENLLRDFGMRDASDSGKEGEVFWEKVVARAIEMRASDIHFVPKTNTYYMYFRVRKNLVLIDEFCLSVQDGRRMLRFLKNYAYKFSKGMFRPDVSSKVQDARVVFDKLNASLRVALAPLPNLEDEVMVARILLQKGSISYSLSKLGYLKDDIPVFNDLLTRSGGVAIVSGITNSGKSTFVSTLLTRVKDRRVATVEDPIEYFIANPNISQHQIFETEVEEIRSTFIDYVRAFKRQDYDIIFVGEWRNNPELSKAIEELSLAGQLVFTTLHINSAFVVFDALESMYKVPKGVILRSLLFSMNQVLVNRPSKKAKKVKIRDGIKILEEVFGFSPDSLHLLPYTNKEDFLSLVEENSVEVYVDEKLTEVPPITPIYEYFYPNVELKEWIAKENPSPFQIEEKARKSGIGKNKLDVFMKKLLSGQVPLNALLAIR